MDTPSVPRVAIITVNWNGSERTIEGVKEMATFSYPNKTIYVVDNDSKEEERNILEQFLGGWSESHEYIQAGGNLGFAGGSNLGIQKAIEQGAEYVMLLNNDTYAPQKDMIERLVQEIEADEAIAAVGPLIYYANSKKVWWAGGFVSYLSGFTRHKGKGKMREELGELTTQDSDYLTGCCLLIKKDVIEQVGLLDESYFLYYEEVDWAEKAKREGLRMVFVPHAELEHDKSASTGKAGSNKLSGTQAYYLARNAFVFARNNLRGLKKWLFYATQFFVRWPANELLFLRSWKSRKAYYAGLWDGIRGEKGIRTS